MDLITPAQTWALNDVPGSTSSHHSVKTNRMPLFQRVVMFCSVVGPFAGLLAGIALLWRGKPAAGGIGWAEVLLMLAMYALAGFGVTIGFHRLLTHRSFDCPRPVRLILAALGSSAGQGMAIRWVATHRRHHQMSDREGDPHSPHLHGDGPLALLRGMWHAHVGWCFDADRPELARSVPDLLADRGMLIVDRLYFVWVGLGILLPAVLLGCLSRSWHGFGAGAIWGGLLRIFLMQHVTWSINSVCHVWGSRPFHSTDHSTNNFPIAIVSLGEGWHNNHHAFPTSARQGLFWWQLDSSYLVIRLMSAIGLAYNVRVPSRSAMCAKLKRPEWLPSASPGDEHTDRGPEHHPRRQPADQMQRS